MQQVLEARQAIVPLTETERHEYARNGGDRPRTWLQDVTRSTFFLDTERTPNGQMASRHAKSMAHHFHFIIQVYYRP